MFWKVAGFTQPSPIEQILDKDDFKLEELLDEDDIIQECKSLNGRLIAFLRHRDTVEGLLRYLVDTNPDSEDPKRQYKYPFTACEVFACEVEGVFTTLLEEPSLMQLLFSFLDNVPPLDSKFAGYFGRVVGHTLIRKTNEMMQYLQDHVRILEKLMVHVQTASIADVLKRIVGADEQSSVLFLPAHTQWLADTPLLDMLLERFGPGFPPEVQSNTSDILCAVAHCQPSTLSAKLMTSASINELFKHALAPGAAVLVPALDVCIALLDPRRSQQEATLDALNPMATSTTTTTSNSSGTNAGGRAEAVTAMLRYLRPLVDHLRVPPARGKEGEKGGGNAGPGGGDGRDGVQQTPFGLLEPPLGSARLKIAELLAVLLSTREGGVDQAVIDTKAIQLCLELFVQFPFNNLFHHQVWRIVKAALDVEHNSGALFQHMSEDCHFVQWLVNLPHEVVPTPLPGCESLQAGKGPLRAGYLGHATQMANALLDASLQRPSLGELLKHDDSWQTYLTEELQPRNEVENLSQWACGRPPVAEGPTLDADGDEYQNDMDLEQMQNMQPALYHRYGVMDDQEDEEEDAASPAHGTANEPFDTGMLTEGMAGMNLGERKGDDSSFLEASLFGAAPSHRAGTATSHAVDIFGEDSMEDDNVLLAASDDDSDGSDENGDRHSAGEHMVIVDEDALGLGDAHGGEMSEAHPNAASIGSNKEAERESGGFTDFHYWRRKVEVAEDV